MVMLYKVAIIRRCMLISVPCDLMNKTRNYKSISNHLCVEHFVHTLHLFSHIENCHQSHIIEIPNQQKHTIVVKLKTLNHRLPRSDLELSGLRSCISEKVYLFSDVITWASSYRPATAGL